MKFLIPFLTLVVLFGFFACKSSAAPAVPKMERETERVTEQVIDENADANIDAYIGGMEEYPGYTQAGEEGQEEPESPGEDAQGDQVFAPIYQPEAEFSDIPEVSQQTELPLIVIPESPSELPLESPMTTDLPSQEPIQEPITQQSPAPSQMPAPQQSPAPVQTPAQEQTPPPREPPSPPPFIRPAEPEVPPPHLLQDPVQDGFELPSRSSPVVAEEEFAFSRIARLTVGQMLEIPFQGTGWVYLGELGNRRGLSYDSRRLDIEGGITIGQSFIFRADASGTYVLKFYKQDFIQDYIINDYVQAIVGERSDDSGNRPGFYADRGRIVAEPRWPLVQGQVAEQIAGQTAGTPAGQPSAASTVEQAGTEPAGTEPALAGDTAAPPPQEVTQPQAADFPALPDEYVRQSRQEFDAGRVEQALSILDLMKQRFPNGTDEAWWLYAQLLEANSPSRDIKLALEYYRRIVEEYPQSNRVGDARSRIAYLERFYINIR
jgi:hypothetical protein